MEGSVASIRRLRNRWQAQVRRRGIPPRAKSFDTRRDAEVWARGLEAELDRSPWVVDRRLTERTTLGEILLRYSQEVTPTKRSAQSELWRIQSIRRRQICFRVLSNLTNVDVAAYRDERLREVAPDTVRRELNTISHALEIARREWGIWLPSNPVQMIRRPRPPRGRTRRVSKEEEQQLLAACDRGRTPWLRPLIILAIETAMRRGELVGLRWGDVDLDTRVAHLDMTKNGERRDVPLSLRATTILREIATFQRFDDHVIQMTGNAVRLAWEHLRVRAGSENLHFHDLRHEAISRLFELGLNVMEVAAISGHKEIKMLQRYTHLRAVDLVARLDSARTR